MTIFDRLVAVPRHICPVCGYAARVHTVRPGDKIDRATSGDGVYLIEDHDSACDHKEHDGKWTVIRPPETPAPVKPKRKRSRNAGPSGHTGTAIPSR